MTSVKRYIEPSLFPDEKLQETPDAEEKEYDFTDLFNTVMSPKFRTGALLKQKSNKGNF